jgi:hypothetical protein
MIASVISNESQTGVPLLAVICPRFVNKGEISRSILRIVFAGRRRFGRDERGEQNENNDSGKHGLV